MREILEQWPDQRLLQLVHAGTGCSNYKTMLRVWPAAPASVYSAGLSNRDASGQIVFGGIPGLYKRATNYRRSILLWSMRRT